MSIVVVLPAPFGPRKATISPERIVRSRPSTAVTEPKRLVSPRSATAGVSGRAVATGADGAVSSMPRASATPAVVPSLARHDFPMTPVTLLAPKPDRFWRQKRDSAGGEAFLQIA